MPADIKWFWAHRRNASLHHFSFLMHGLSGKGWEPAVNFWFDNQIVIGVPGKGCYVFYDENQLNSKAKYKDVQESIDNNPNFVTDFRRRTDEIFGAIFFKAIAIDEANLSLLPNKELHRLYTEYIQAMMVAPIITVQLWGIEACFDENYLIMKFLRQRRSELGRGREFQFYKEMLSVNVGETVPFTEQKDFYRVAEALDKPEIVELFKGNSDAEVSKKLRKHIGENELLEKHMTKYEWVHTEYVSGGWSREKWIGLLREILLVDERPKEKLAKLLAGFNDLNQKRTKAIEELKPSDDVRHAIDALSELIAQRDWTKGYFTKLLLSHNKLLGEVARRMGLEKEDLLYYSYKELDDYLTSDKVLSMSELKERKSNGYAIVIKHGELELVTGKEIIKSLIEKEGISEPFEKIASVSSFKGLAASMGVVRGKARVLEDASRLSELEKGEILVTYMTTIEFTPAFRKASGVITDEGGMSCHAAIVSREFKIPCVVGTKIATRVLQTGDEIEIDGGAGKVKILKHVSPTSAAEAVDI